MTAKLPKHMNMSLKNLYKKLLNNNIKTVSQSHDETEPVTITTEEPPTPELINKNTSYEFIRPFSGEKNESYDRYES